MKIYKIESRRGWVCLPERIASFDFPMSFGSKVAATPFWSRQRAQRAIDKHNLRDAHIEEMEFEE